MRRLRIFGFAGAVLLTAFALTGKGSKEGHEVRAVPEPPVCRTPVPAWRSLYDSLGLKSRGLSEVVFAYAWQGVGKVGPRKPVLAIADFSQSSKNKRLYVIDLKLKKLLMQTFVAHGRNSGSEFARRFSNKEGSFQSSLGFYKTLNTYQGKHGLSLRLQGLEPGINDKALERAIVVHGADYVSDAFIRATGRLGRSQGCPAVPVGESKKLIPLLREGACLFLFSPDNAYLSASALLHNALPGKALPGS